MIKLGNIGAKRIAFICFIILSTLFLINLSVGEENQSVRTNDNTYSQGYDSFGDTIRLLASLLFVLALIVGGIYLLKRVPLYKRFATGIKNPISILSSTSLLKKRSISIVRVADEILILGLTNTNISILSKMKADEYFNSEKTLTKIEDEEISESNNGFLEQLKKAIKNRR